MGDFSSLELLHVNSSYIKQQTPVLPCECQALKEKQEPEAAALKCQVSWDIESPCMGQRYYTH